MVGAIGFEPMTPAVSMQSYLLYTNKLFILQKVKFLHLDRTELQLFDHQV